MNRRGFLRLLGIAPVAVVPVAEIDDAALRTIAFNAALKSFEAARRATRAVIPGAMWCPQGEFGVELVMRLEGASPIIPAALRSHPHLELDPVGETA